MTTAHVAQAPRQQPESEPLRVPLREGPHAASIEPRAFTELLDLMRARPVEMKWASIPWQTDLWETRRLAREASKPIFMWAMNGNPLGCV